MDISEQIVVVTFNNVPIAIYVKFLPMFIIIFEGALFLYIFLPPYKNLFHKFAKPDIMYNFNTSVQNSLVNWIVYIQCFHLFKEKNKVIQLILM